MLSPKAPSQVRLSSARSRLPVGLTLLPVLGKWIVHAALWPPQWEAVVPHWEQNTKKEKKCRRTVAKET